MLAITSNEFVMNNENKYLSQRSGVYYFARRTPQKLKAIDSRNVIRQSLKTTDIHIARKKRDEMILSTNKYWQSLSYGQSNNASTNFFDMVMERTRLHNIDYIRANEFNSRSEIAELVTRISALESCNTSHDHVDVDALLGLAEKPKIIVSKMFEIYINRIAIQDQENKTKDQVRVWKKAKTRAIENFINLCGDIPVSHITRKHAINFFDWWMKRVTGQDGTIMKPGTAQKDIGNLKKIYSEYYKYYGDEDRKNPFRNLRFKDVDIEKHPAFSHADIKSIFNSPKMLNLNFEARMILLICADTGCRPSEICGLEKSNIHLDVEHPYIEIKDMPGRKLKTRSSNRTVPLIGVALHAMKQIPNGPVKYKFGETQLSATTNKFLRRNKFLPTPKHSLYSFRHAIMDRMEEADIEDEFRRRLLGHSINKPNYGDGGRMAFRHQKLKQIEIAYNSIIFSK